MASDYPPKIDNLITAVQVRFTTMAIITALETIAIGWLAGRTIGAGIGTAVGAACFFIIRDWGRKLDHRPRGLHLVKARTGAALMMVLLPAGPFIAWRLLKRLREPVLVRHAVANHPEAGSQSDEQLVATIRARSAFVTLRTIGIVVTTAGVIGTFLGVLAFLDLMAGNEVSTTERIMYACATGALPVGIYMLACAIVGLSRLQELSAERIASARKIAWMVFPMIPYGPYVTWTVTRAFRDDRPAADVG